MTKEEKARILTALLGMAEVYGRTLSEVTQRLYLAVLDGYECQDVVQAFMRHIEDPEHGQFMPKPADIVRQIRGDPEGEAHQAWAKLMWAVRDHGSYASVVFDDALIHAVVQQMGGWVRIGEFTQDELPFRMKDFVALYRSHRQRAEVPQYPPVLLGIIATQNTFLGFADDVPEPVLVGDRTKALAVLDGGTLASQGRLGVQAGAVVKMFPGAQT